MLAKASASALQRIPAEPSSWLDSLWLGFEPAVVKGVRVASPDLEQPLELTREERRYVWRAGDRTVPKSKVEALLDAARGLFVSDAVAGAGDGSDALGEVALGGVAAAEHVDGVESGRTGLRLDLRMKIINFDYDPMNIVY